VTEVLAIAVPALPVLSGLLIQPVPLGQQTVSMSRALS
jgi:hypothetical protein